MPIACAPTLDNTQKVGVLPTIECQIIDELVGWVVLSQWRDMGLFCAILIQFLQAAHYFSDVYRTGH
jgi:hypothetical protein